MKRDFLKELDLGEGARLSDAAIEAIMTEYGRTTGPIKDSVTALTQERDALRAQLADVQNWEEKYNTDTQALQGQVHALQKSIDTRNARDKVSASTGVPANLLTGDTEEACKAQADAILAWKNDQPKYPESGDGGEPLPPPGASGGALGAWADISEQLRTN